MDDKFKISDIFKKYQEEKKPPNQGAESSQSGSKNKDDKFKISNIFKKSQEEKKPPNQGAKSSQPGKTQEAEKQTPDKISLSSAIKKQKESESVESVEVNTLYSGAVSYARYIYKNLTVESDTASRIYALVTRIVDLINADDKELLKVALADYLHPEDYLYYHVVNVCIISLQIARGLAYDRAQLLELGVGAFLHDIGISRNLDVINQPKTLNPQEYDQVKQHPTIGPQILDKISENFDPRIFEVMRQEHERIDGSGYPKGLKKDEIIEFAQIVGISDVYEAMIHTRPYRGKHTPLEAIKTILSNKKAFTHKLVKILIERIGIFPIGTFVQLNTKEIGQILKQTPELPLRPVVNIIFEASGKRLEPRRQIDLANNPTVYILGISSVPS